VLGSLEQLLPKRLWRPFDKNANLFGAYRSRKTAVQDFSVWPIRSGRFGLSGLGLAVSVFESARPKSRVPEKQVKNTLNHSFLNFFSRVPIDVIH